MERLLILGLLVFSFSSLTLHSQELTGDQMQVVNSKMVENDRGSDLLIPSAFTPNGDGKNDIFKILNFTNQRLVEFRVFNRWGTVLFKTTNPQEGWDGMFKHTMQPTGLYGYVIRIAYREGVEETYKGTVTLIR